MAHKVPSPSTGDASAAGFPTLLPEEKHGDKARLGTDAIAYKGYSFSLAWRPQPVSGSPAYRLAICPGAGERIVAGTDLLTQARVAYAKIAIILQAGGLDCEHVVRWVVSGLPKGMAHYPHPGALRQELSGLSCR